MKRQQKVELLPELVESIIGDAADVFILFIDLCGSTEYKQRCILLKQPDLTWIFRQLIFLQRAAEIIKKHEGVVAKTTGDGIIAFFEAITSPESILKCAIEVIQGYENLGAFKNHSKIEVKTSIDFGRVYNGSIVDSVPFDPIGLPVDRCARLNSLAKNNEILFSEDFLSIAEAKSSAKKLKAKYGYDSHIDDLKGIGKVRYFTITAK
jgi:class 3 adenylate cyclase